MSRMNIVYTTDFDFNDDFAPAVHVLEVCRNFRLLGHRVVLFAPKTGTRPYLAPIDTVLIRTPRAMLAVFYQLSLLVRLGVEIVLRRPDFIYSRHSHLLFVPTLVARAFGVPIVQEVNSRYGDDARFNKGAVNRLLSALRVFHALELFNFRNSQRMIGVTAGIRDHVISTYGIPADRVTFVSSGVDTDVFKPMPKPTHGEIVVGYVGSFASWQGVEHIVKAAEIVCAGRADVRFSITGKGPEGPRIASLVAASPFADRIGLHPPVAHAEVPAIIGSSDICICYPIGIRAGATSPFKVYEYLACGKAVVIADIGGMREEFGDNVTYAQPESPEALAAAIAPLLADSALRKEMGERARRHVERSCSWLAATKKLEAVCIEATGVRRKGGLRRIVPSLLERLSADVLFRNSLCLMLATAVMAGFGFFFWLINARLYGAADIGVATTLIAIMNLIATLSLAGFDMAFVRFLPTSETRNQKLNTGFLVVSVTALLLASGFIALVHLISPSLTFVRQSPLYSAAFVLFAILMALNIITDSVFLAYRKAEYTLAINTIFSFAKMMFPLFFVSLGATGIYLAAALAQVIGFTLSMAALIRHMGYRPQLRLDGRVIKLVAKYCAGNYFAGAFNLIPVTYLPILITNRLGPASSAYFYVVMMIGNMLYTVAWATTRSLFAEGSHDQTELKRHIRKAIGIMAPALAAAAAFLLLFGEWLLRMFGKNYGTGGIRFLDLITLACVPVAIVSFYTALFRISKNLKALVITNVVYAAALIGFANAFLRFGLAGIGFAWIVGNAITALCGLILYVLSRKSAALSRQNAVLS